MVIDRSIKNLFQTLGIREYKAKTLVGTFRFCGWKGDSKAFVKTPVGIRDNSGWAFAQHLVVSDKDRKEMADLNGVRERWTQYVNKFKDSDPLVEQQLLYVPNPENEDGWVVFNAKGEAFAHGTIEEVIRATTTTTIGTFSPAQIIYYGVPGCGKSHEVQKETKSLPKDRVMRVVFHPDYSNADFVGQILPHVDGKDVSYEFTPGPFAKILKKALRSNEPHALVIEEINRGNAAAIFGEVFQLLDRYRDEKPAGDDDWEPNIGKSRIGWSKYSIINEELEKYIVNAKDAASGAEATVVDENKVPREHMLECGLVFHVGDGIRIPPNLSIYATMNTSDQNVFTLDNAFQRRWEMKQIPNTLNNAEEGEEKKQYECEIEATGVQWGLFRDAINELIMESAQESGLSSMEDKRLGGWFITPDKGGVISKDAFANKVLKYLWDDAFKFDRQKRFGNVKTLEDLIERFTEDAGFNVFQDSSIKNLKSAEPIDSGEDDGPAEPADGTAES